VGIGGDRRGDLAILAVCCLLLAAERKKRRKEEEKEGEEGDVKDGGQ